MILLSEWAVHVVTWDELPAQIKAVTKRRMPREKRNLEPDLVFVHGIYCCGGAWWTLLDRMSDRLSFQHQMCFGDTEIVVTVTLIPAREGGGQ